MESEKHEICIGPAIVNAIVRLGRAQEVLKAILQDHIPDTISKHDEKWQSEYEREDEMLYDARVTLNALHDKLWDLHGLLEYGGVEE